MSKKFFENLFLIVILFPIAIQAFVMLSGLLGMEDFVRENIDIFINMWIYSIYLGLGIASCFAIIYIIEQKRKKADNKKNESR